MSKSKGNTVDPEQVYSQYGVDVFRYFLLSEAGMQDDTDFSHERISVRYTNELAVNIGNLIKRAAAPALNKHSGYPPYHPNLLSSEEKDHVSSASKMVDEVSFLFDHLDFRQGITAINKFLQNLNKMWSIIEPWNLAKETDPSRESHKRVDNLLYITLHSVRISSVLLLPVMPSKMSHLLDLLGVQESQRDMKGLRASLHSFSQVSLSPTAFSSSDLSDKILFPPLTPKKEQKKKK